MKELIAPWCLAVATILQEAEGEPYEGKVAVARVIRERMRLRYYSDGTVAGTILKPFQFSGWNTDGNRARSCNADLESPSVQSAIRAWEESGRTPDQRFEGVTHYHADYVTPKWRNDKYLKRAFRIGRHIFYKQVKKADGKSTTAD